MTTKPSPWDWALSFRAHEAACLIAGTPMPQSLNPSKEELPADARPVRTSIIMAYVKGEIYKAGKPVREDYPVEMTLTSSEESEEFTVESFTKARFQREELHRWLNATGRHSEYSFAPTHQAVAVAVMPAQASEAPQPAPAAPPEAVLMPPQAAPDDGTRPVQRQHAQEQAIMRLIREAEHNPLQLPMNEPGKPGIKSHVRKLVMRDPIFTGATVFDKTWERLSSRGEIAYQQ